MFVDKVSLKLQAGKGGNGVVSWRREAHIPKGGPWGGNGGPGGSVIVRADCNTHSLDAFRYQRQIDAENGGDGASNLRQGRMGKVLVVKVPPGTLVKDNNSKAIIADLQANGEEVLLLKGGKGGRGNASFATPQRRAPHFATKGIAGEALDVELELKTIADVGLIGFPNAGKSSLLNAWTHQGVTVASYPFTTLHPNVGYAYFSDFSKILFADVPGIIEHAAQNKGLGLDFLRHIDRCPILAFVLDAAGQDCRDPSDDFRILKSELIQYSQELLERPRIVVLNKIDCLEAQEAVVRFQNNFPEETIFQISAKEGLGLEKPLLKLRELLSAAGMLKY